MSDISKTKRLEYAKELTDLSAALSLLAHSAPERTTASQLVFFLLAAAADASGRPATFTDIKDAAGPRINKSMHTTYKLFLEGKRRRHDASPDVQGLGWLRREEDPMDMRRKYLRLTMRGYIVVDALCNEIKRKRG